MLSSKGGTLKSRKLLIGLMIGALLIAACGSDNGTDTTSAGADPTTTEGAGDTTAPEAMTGVHTSETDLGTILVDADGFTLYAFTPDTDGVSTCYDQCAEVWPAAPGDSEIGSDLDAAMFGTAARTDGGDQLTVNGQPLYRYTPDANPGDTSGQGVSNVWFVVDADGAMVGAP
jgi:predicted lipoprotein with Yx(FWY)xxD motif